MPILALCSGQSPSFILTEEDSLTSASSADEIGVELKKDGPLRPRLASNELRTNWWPEDIPGPP